MMRSESELLGLADKGLERIMRNDGVREAEVFVGGNLVDVCKMFWGFN